MRTFGTKTTCLHNVFVQKYKKSLFSLYSTQPTGNSARRLRNLAGMVSALLRSKKATIHSIGQRLPSQADVESRIKRVKRSLGNKWNDWEFQYLPCLHRVLALLGRQGCVQLVIDGSQIGTSCTALMLSVLWGNTALPLCWLVKEMPKGHFPASMHQDLLKTVAPVLRALLPPQCRIVILGDGEFGNIELQQSCQELDFDYVFRIPKDTLLYEDEITEEAFSPQNIPKQDLYYAPDVYMTAQRFGVVHFVAYHEKAYEHPLYLISNIDHPPSIIKYYKKRFIIETLFGNIKSRGFNIHKTKVNNPDIINGLLIVVSWAYVWLVYLGKAAQKQENYAKFARKDRQDWSINTLAWAFLDFLTDNDNQFYLNLSRNYG